MAWVFDKYLECGKHLRSERNGFIVAEEKFLFRIQTKVSELVKMWGFRRHYALFTNFSAKAHRKLKTSGLLTISFREQAVGFAGF
jgi:hypothetical protein